MYEFRSRCLRAKQHIDEIRLRNESGQISIDALAQAPEIKAEFVDIDDCDSRNYSASEVQDNEIDEIPQSPIAKQVRRSKRQRNPVIAPQVNEISGIPQQPIGKRGRRIKKQKNTAIPKEPRTKRRKSYVPENVESTGIAVGEDPGLYLCAHCGLSFDNNGDFIKHSKVHSKGIV